MNILYISIFSYNNSIINYIYVTHLNFQSVFFILFSNSARKMTPGVRLISSLAGLKDRHYNRKICSVEK